MKVFQSTEDVRSNGYTTVCDHCYSINHRNINKSYHMELFDIPCDYCGNIIEARENNIPEKNLLKSQTYMRI